jgi:hypothetical protein
MSCVVPSRPSQYIFTSRLGRINYLPGLESRCMCHASASSAIYQVPLFKILCKKSQFDFCGSDGRSDLVFGLGFHRRSHSRTQTRANGWSILLLVFLSFLFPTSATYSTLGSLNSKSTLLFKNKTTHPPENFAQQTYYNKPYSIHSPSPPASALHSPWP